jgi:hypothetical protein
MLCYVMLCYVMLPVWFVLQICKSIVWEPEMPLQELQGVFVCSWVCVSVSVCVSVCSFVLYVIISVFVVFALNVFIF